MYRYNYLYTDKEGLQNLIFSGELDKDANYLICIHTAVHKKNEINNFVSEIKGLFPYAQIAGTSACDIIFNGKLFDDKCLVSFMSFDETIAEINIFSCLNKTSCELASEFISKAYKNDTSLIYTFFSDKYSGAARFIDEINRLNCSAKLIGGFASNTNSKEDSSYIFTSDGIAENSLLSISLNNVKLMVSNHSITGYDTIGDYHTITKAVGNEVAEIDDVPAVKWFQELLGCECFLDMDEVDYNGQNDALIRFPLILKGYKKSSRTLQYHSDGDKLTQHFVDCEEGQKFRIGYLSKRVSSFDWETAYNTFVNTPVESLFCYSCVLRKIWFCRCAAWELEPFIKGKICGALLYGEIAYIDGKNEFLNGTCNLIAAAENNNYIELDNYNNKNLDRIKDEFKSCYYNALENISRQMCDKNNKLIQQIEKQENYLNDRIFIDANTGIDNVNKLMFDNKDRNYKSGCLVTVESGELIVSHFGIKEFSRILAQGIEQVYHFMNENYSDINIWIYIYDEYSFLIVTDSDVSSKRFVQASKEIYERFAICHVDGVSYSYVNRFLVVINEKNMLDKIKLVKANLMLLPERLFIYDASIGLETTAEKLINSTKIINYAIENDGVLPYFQPIFDNATGKIDKFEALMRIRDKNGYICFPSQFMEAAKKQGLYSQLSRIMINKVFDLFEKRSETVSINLSAIDINSTETCRMIYERLERIGNAERFIFEVLESEEFRDNEGLIKFIEKVREHNVKIAIDDFGSGFSNLLEIAKLSPNFIKIDGQIVREVVDSEIHQKIVGTILHLADKFNIDLVAEFIENESLQDYASNNGVRYSQGYYFSQAVPFDQIDEIIKIHNS